jgi:hypothetical protein
MTTPPPDKAVERLTEKELEQMARSIAVEFVDAGYGYTMEYNVNPQSHRDAYDEATRCVLSALNRRTIPPAAISDARLDVACALIRTILDHRDECVGDHPAWVARLERFLAENER